MSGPSLSGQRGQFQRKTIRKALPGLYVTSDPRKKKGLPCSQDSGVPETRIHPLQLEGRTPCSFRSLPRKLISFGARGPVRGLGRGGHILWARGALDSNGNLTAPRAQEARRALAGQPGRGRKGPRGLCTFTSLEASLLALSPSPRYILSALTLPALPVILNFEIWPRPYRSHPLLHYSGNFHTTQAQH